MSAPLSTNVRVGQSPVSTTKVRPPVIIRDEPTSPPATLLLGDIGAGKTHSIITALKAGLEVFVLVTENTGVDTLIDACEKEKVSIDNLHWKRCTPTQQSWEVMRAQAKLTNSYGVGEIQKLETGLDRFKYPAFGKLIDACADFICDRTKKSFGDVMTWDDSRLLVLDSQSGLNEIVSDHVKGHRITMTQPEFGVVQNHIYNLINTFCGLNCYVLVTGHLESEVDEVAGTSKFMVSTVGKKLAPKLPRLFSEVVLAKVENGKYVWTTMDPKVATKTRALPRGTMPADFALLVKAYNERKIKAAKELSGEITA